METNVLLRKLNGVHTIESVMDILGVDKEKAVYYIFRLRKLGYVRTKRLAGKKRLYNFSFENRLGGKSYYEILNEFSPIKLSPPNTFKIYGKNIGFEETIVFAVKSGSLRVVLSSLALFKKVGDWGLLYRLAKSNGVVRQVGALYDLAKKFMRVRRMTKRFRDFALPKEIGVFVYVIPNLRSNDFVVIENLWRVYLPFNLKDLEGYV
jgi:hypothetical protein